MRYAEFKDYVQQHILELLPEEYKTSEVRVNAVTKNNGLVLDGLTVTKPNSNISPTIYLNSFYQDMEDGKYTLEECMEKIAQVQVENESPQIDTSKFRNYDDMKDKLFIRVVNKDYNSKLLETVPHTCIDNLAITYSLLATDGIDGIGTARISYDLMNAWGITENELHETAMKNTPNLFPATFKSMKEVLLDMGMPEELMPDSEPQMYVLSNDKGINGASALFYPGMMEEIANKLGSSYVVLPSSIHETIVLPVDDSMSKDRLIEMVKEVNETQVAPEEVLADTAYFYDRSSGVFHNLENENPIDKSIQQSMEYLEKVATDYYNQSAEHPSLEGRNEFLEEIRKSVEEKGYQETLSDLKDKQSDIPKDMNREMEQEMVC